MIATFWQQMPFVRLIIPLILGITCAENEIIDPLELFILLASSLLIQFTLYKFVKKYWFEPIHGILHFIAYFLLGFTLLELQNFQFHQDHFNKVKSEWLLVQTESKPKSSKKLVSFDTKAISAKTKHGNWIPVSGKLHISLSRDSLSLQLNEGDQLLIKSNFHEISPPLNPGDFNYKGYMAKKGVYYQQIIFGHQWKFYQKTKAPLLQQLATQWQNNISKILAQFLFSEAEIGVSEALLFGLDDHIPDDIILAYSKTGTLHVLAVSGMHVGLIYLVIGWLIKGIKRFKWGRQTEPFIALLGIWLYALLCGLSPSILRASLMFSLMIVGKLIQRSGNVYNSLAASAFFLLCYQPSLVWHAGFQLSYAAVLGIIIFYKPIYQSLFLRTKILDEIWKVIAISIAAQILTFPISIYYFHQFPNYFIPANLILIPLTTLLIYLGILLVICHKIGLVAGALAWLISKLIQLTNFLVSYLASLPFASIENIYFPLGLALFCYAWIACLSVWIKQKSAVTLKVFLWVSILGFGLNLSLIFLQNEAATFTIYASPKNFIFSYTNKKYGWVWLNHPSDKNLKFIQSHFVTDNIQTRELNTLDTNTILITVTPTLKVLYLHKHPQKWPRELSVLVMSKDARLPDEKTLKSMKVLQVVILQEVKPKQRKYILDECKKSNRQCYDVASQGAFIWKE
jgi:competence protein ComEC